MAPSTMPSASSSPGKSIDLKPGLNPCALSYEPAQIGKQQIIIPYSLPHEICPSHQTPYEPAPDILPPVLTVPSVVVYYTHPPSVHQGFGYYTTPGWNNGAEYLYRYSLHKQPHPQIEVFGVPKFVQYDGISLFRKKQKKVKRKPPPRQLLRDNPVHSQISVCVPTKPACTAEVHAKVDGKTSLMIRNIPNHLR